jgi:DNA-binding NarL/FixJ family response regulator
MGKGNNLRILVADDHAVVRQGLIQILTDAGGIEVVADVGNGNDVLRALDEHQVDVLLMDHDMPGKSGLDILVELRSLHPKLPVIILSIFPEDHYGPRFLKAGASGYLMKTSDPQQLISAVRIVAQGGKFASPHLTEKLISELHQDGDKALHESLSDREFQVFFMLASGKKLKDIADELSLSINTISTHRSRILQKMGMQGNAELIHYALKNGLIV